MGANASRSPYVFDAAAAVTLRNGTDTAETATAAEVAKSINELNSAYWHDHEIPHGKFVVVFDVHTLVTGGGEVYNLSLLVDDVVAMNNSPVTVGGPIAVNATGQYTIVLDSAIIPQLDTDHSSVGKFLQAKVTITGGGSPSISYACWIAKSLGA